MSKDYVVVTCILSHRIRYVMHKDDLQKLNPDAEVDMIEWANDTVTMEECEEFSQKYMGEYIVDTNLLSEEEMLELFDKDNDYLKDWTLRLNGSETLFMRERRIFRWVLILK